MNCYNKYVCVQYNKVSQQIWIFTYQFNNICGDQLQFLNSDVKMHNLLKYEIKKKSWMNSCLPNFFEDSKSVDLVIEVIVQPP